MFRFSKTIGSRSRRRKCVIVSVATGAALGTIASLRANEYDVAAIGIVRLSRAVTTVFEIGRYYRKQLYGTGLDKASEEYRQLKSKVHKLGAEKLLGLCCVNKGVYIKVGQHIGALDYLLPPEYVETMRVLHSSAPRSSFSDILTVIKEDFKKDASEIFESIDPTPVGTASLAQVHKAVLKDGTSVAVKVQHRAVKANAWVDIKTMAALAKITAWVFPDFKFDWIVNESKRNIPMELDFTREGKNAEKANETIKGRFPWLKIPKIYWKYSSPRVLTMEYLEGGQVNDLNYLEKNNVNPTEVSTKLGSLYSFMIFSSGFVHSDPHPGNILIRKSKAREAEIILLDHGLYATLSDDFRREYAKLWLAILNRNKADMKQQCVKLGVDEFYAVLICMISGRSWETIMTGIQKHKFTTSEKAVFQEEVPQLLPQISQVLGRVHREMLLVLRTNDLLRGIEHTLKTQERLSAFLMSKDCLNMVYDAKKKTCATKLEKFGVVIEKQWSLTKLHLYYAYLNIRNFDLLRTIKAVWSREAYCP